MNVSVKTDPWERGEVDFRMLFLRDVVDMFPIRNWRAESK
jgi:hypothetical protein